MNHKETFQNIWKFSELSEFFKMDRKLSCLSGSMQVFSTLLAFPESLIAIRIVSRQTENTIDSWESFKTPNFQDCLKTFHTVWNLSGLSGFFPNVLKTFRFFWKTDTYILEFVAYLFCPDTFWYVKFVPEYLETFRLI